MQPLVSARVAAKHYGVSKLTIYRWFAAKKIRGVKIGRTIRIDLSENGSARAREAVDEAAEEPARLTVSAQARVKRPAKRSVKRRTR